MLVTKFKMRLQKISLVLVISVSLCGVVDSLVSFLAMPKQLSECYFNRTRGVTAADLPTQDISNFCIDQLVWNTSIYHEEVPESAEQYVASLVRKVLGDKWNSRHKRQVNIRSNTFIRKEIRHLTREEWYQFTQRVRMLKSQTDVAPNRYDAIAMYHQRQVLWSAHGGPNFLSWHRLFLLVLEAALGFPIPYWDSSIDYAMLDPVHSVVWTSHFFGNGFGRVTTGPFAWYTPAGPLIRNIGTDGSLMRRHGGTYLSGTAGGIDGILSQYFMRDICEGTYSGNPIYSLENQHNGPHVWVDGHFAMGHTAAYDPIFFMHHAFIDYLWERFRQKQRSVGVDPQTDFPDTYRPRHGPYDIMDAFDSLRNIDGYGNWVAERTQYQMSPECPYTCDNEWLQCVNGLCIPKEAPYGERALNPPSSGFSQRITPRNNRNGFRATFRDPRTLGSGQQAFQNGGQLFQTQVVQPQVAQQQTLDPFLSQLLRFKRSASTKLPTQSPTEYSNHTDYVVHEPYHNNFLLDGVPNENRWAFITVKVFYRRPVKEEDLHSANGETRHLGSYEKCSVTAPGTAKVFVQSDGINYSGRYKDFIVMGAHEESSFALVHVGIKRPTNGSVETYITAHDTCGRACSPSCLESNTPVPVYKSCSGVVRITDQLPLMYSNTRADAHAAEANKVRGIPTMIKETPNNQAPVIFNCDLTPQWPWKF